MWSPSWDGSWHRFYRCWEVLGAKLGRKTEPRAIKNRSLRASKKSWKKECVLEASWSAKTPQEKPGLAMEREARFYSYAVALYGYLLCVSALANCKSTLAGRAILPHLTDAVCIELRFNMFRFPFFVSRFYLFSLFSLRRYARFTRFARSRAARAQRIETAKPQLRKVCKCNEHK